MTMTEDRRPTLAVVSGGAPDAPSAPSATPSGAAAKVNGDDALPDSAGAPLVMDERVDPWRVASWHTSLGRTDAEPAPGDPLPPMWHFLFFPEVQRPEGLGVDGHPRPGGFLPDTGLPRRMRAGGRMEFLAPLPIGAEARRVSVIQNVAIKQGGSGSLAIVTVRHEISGPDGVAMREEEDLVYRAAASPDDKPRPKAPAKDETPTFSRDFTADPVLLFRYSALTFNPHRIHYDQPYCTQEEGYPDLVVHGPLIATLMVDLCRRSRPDAEIKEFSFRALAPLFVDRDMSVAGAPSQDGSSAAVWAANDKDELASQGEVIFA